MKSIIKSTDKIILVSLNKSFDHKNASGVYLRPNIYEATRKYWKVNINRAKQADTVFGVYKGIVQSVYNPSKWFPMDVAEDGTLFSSMRYGFDGIEPENALFWLGSDITDYPFGSGGAIRYINI